MVDQNSSPYEKTRTRLGLWADAATGQCRHRQDAAASGNTAAAAEEQERAERYRYVTTVDRDSRVQAAADTWEESHAGMGLGPFQVETPNLPTGVLNRLVWLGFEPDRIMSSLESRIDEHGHISSEAVAAVVAELTDAEPGTDATYLQYAEERASSAEWVEHAERQAYADEAEIYAHLHDDGAENDGAAGEPIPVGAPHLAQGTSSDSAHASIEAGHDGDAYVAPSRSADEEVSDAELRSAVNRSLEMGELITFEDWAAANGFGPDTITDEDEIPDGAAVPEPTPAPRAVSAPVTSGAEIQAAIQRGLADGSIISAEEAMRRMDTLMADDEMETLMADDAADQRSLADGSLISGDEALSFEDRSERAGFGLDSLAHEDYREDDSDEDWDCDADEVGA